MIVTTSSVTTQDIIARRLLNLRVKARESLAESAEREADAEYADKVIEKVGDGATITFPPLLADQEVDDLLHDMVHRLEAQNLTLNDYLQAENKTEAEVRDELRPRAEDRVRRALLLGKVVEDEELKVGDEQISERVQRLAGSVQDPEGNIIKALSTPQSMRRIENDLLFESAISRLVSIAKGEKPEKGNPKSDVEDTEEESAVSESEEPELAQPEDEGEDAQEESPESEVLEIQESKPDGEE